MKTNWPTKKLGEVCEIFADGDWIETKDQSSFGIRLIQTGNVGNGVFLNKESKSRYISEQTFKQLNCTEIFPGDILISRLPDPVGRACIIPDIGEKMITAVDCTIIRTNEKQLLSKFLLFYTESPDYYIQVDKHLSGTTRKRISKGNLATIEIPLPPLTEQKKIVAKLEEVLAKISEAKKLRAEARENTDNLLSTELYKIFEEGKKNYSLEELSRVATLVRGPFGGSLKKEIFVSAGDCVYEQGNVIDNDLENFRYYIIPEKFDEMKRFAVSAGDILMSCSGTIGRFVIILSDFKKGIINQALLKITPNQKITAAFLKYALEDYLLLNNTHVKGMAIKNIAAVKELKKIKIPLPPIAEQKKIVAWLDSLSQKIQKLQEYQKATQSAFLTLEQSVLSKAFTEKL